MSERRAARHPETSSGRHGHVSSELPPDLAMGPCVEVWAKAGPNTTGAAHWCALRNWQHAVDEWAESTGWAHEGRPAMNAPNLARTHRQWSRAFLLQHGEDALVDFYEGRIPGTVKRSRFLAPYNA